MKGISSKGMNKKLDDTGDIVNIMVPTSKAIKKVGGKKEGQINCSMIFMLRTQAESICI